VVLAAVLALAIIFADLRFNELAASRAMLSAVSLPFYWLTDLPSRISEWGEESVQTRSALREENGHLRTEAMLLKGQVQQMAALRAENVRLRALLNSSALLQDDVLVAELIGVSPDPVRQQIILNKGAVHGVYVGQPLIDAGGLMGQVIEVGSHSSVVLLITDVTHSIPVQVNRNGVRAIAEGVGKLDTLVLRHVSGTTDIEEGDLLVTSGLGRRFPVGYPVGVVSEVKRDPGEAFTTVRAVPSAALNRSRHVLLVFTGGSEEQENQP